MKLLDLINSPWAIEPAKLIELQEIYVTHIRGEKIDLAALEASLGRPLQREQQGYEVRDNVAIVPIDGVIAQKANLFSRVSGGASSQLIERDIRGALADASVRAIILETNSPGGTVFGTQELARFIDAARAEKPIATFATGQVASAAFWMGAASDQVYISGDNVLAGSIGVVASHVDRSQADKQLGLTRTEIVAGKFKRMASELGPLTPEGRANMQEMVDYLYSVFVGDVAAYRGVTVDKALADMADGRVFIGKQAIDAGLVDGVSTLDDLVAMLSAGRMPRRPPTKKPQSIKRVTSGGVPAVDAPAAAAPAAAIEPQSESGGGAPQAQAESTPSSATGEHMETQTIAVSAITRELLATHHPSLIAAILAEGATAERARIQSVEAAAMPGHTELVQKLKFDGKTTGGEAALQIIAAEKAKLGSRAADLITDAAALNKAQPDAKADPAGEAAAAAEADAGKTPEERAKATWDKDANVRAEFGNLETYLAYAKNQGKVRVLGGKRAA